MDTGQKLTDEELKKLERRITKEYKTAVKEMEQKLKDYLEETEAGRQVQLQLYRAGKISKDEYDNWVYRHTMVGRRWEAMRDTLAADMHRTNEIAKAMSEGQAADVFALNGNYATYQLEHDGKIDTGFTLYNHDTAQYLLEDQRQLMPVPSDKKAREIAANKDMRWNMKKIQSAVLQGVMQGESPYAVAERLEQVGQMNHNSAVRYARTMTTSAQNAGRYEAYRRADKLGVNLSIEWQATLDSRTRHDHRLMHGQRRKVDEPFVLPDGQEILFPADCSHNSYELQGEIWNCRCTLLSWVKGFEGDTVKDSPKMDGMSFEEWQKVHAPEETPLPAPVSQTLSFKERIQAIIDRTGAGQGVLLSEEDIKEAGAILADDFNARQAENERLLKEAMGDREIEIEKAHNRYKDARDDYNRIEEEAYERFKRREITRDEYQAIITPPSEKMDDTRKAWHDLEQEARDIKKKYTPTQKQQADWLAEKIGEVREVGSRDFNLKAHLDNSKSQVVDSIVYAYNHYPRDWVEASVKKSRMYPRVSRRGWYGHNEIRISGAGNSAIETSFHELGHRFEETVPGIKDAEKAFYARRTSGEPLERLCDIFPGYGYERNEVTRRDKFLHAYMGKDYGYGSWFELCSMGFEDAYMNPEILAQDRDMQEWIYGLLLLR